MEESRHQKRSIAIAARNYLIPLGLTVLVPYAWVIGGVIAPGRSLDRIFIWLKGSVGLNPDRHWSWHSGGWMGPWLWLKASFQIFWGSFWPYGNLSVSPTLWIITAISGALFISLLVRGRSRNSERLSQFSWLWLGVYSIFLMSWEPHTLCYRITDVLPLGILLAQG